MHHHRRLALVSGLLALATILPSQAQSWRGSEAIGVQADDSKGKPIAGARVVVSFQGRGSEGNPPVVATDQKGRAVVAGLAPGPWQVEVQHPEFLTYVAVFDLQQGKKPSINASFLEAGGGSLTPMKVKLSKGNPRDASPPLPAREARSPAPAPSEPARATVEAAPTPAPEEVSRPAEVTTTEEPRRQDEALPEPEPEPAESTRAPEATVAEEPRMPAPEDSAPPIEEPMRPEAQETPIPEPAPEPVPEPEPEPLTAPQQVSPQTMEPPAPAAREPEPEPEPTLETATAPEPERPSEVPPEEAVAEEVAATGEAPAELESSPVGEVVDDIPEPQAPPPSVPQAISPEPVEDAPPVELEQALDAPQAPQTEAPAVEEATPPRSLTPPARIPIPDDTPTISSYHDGSCSECRTGEWAVTSDQTVAAGTVGCPTEATQAAREAAEGLGNSTQLELSGFIGPATDGSGTGALASVEPAISQAIQQQMAAHLGGTSNCQMVSVVLPKAVRFVGYRYEAFDAAGGGECVLDRGCLLSSARWLANPVVQRGFNATVVWGLFENTADNTQRMARLKVYFRPPSAQWKPPTP